MLADTPRRLIRICRERDGQELRAFNHLGRESRCTYKFDAVYLYTAGEEDMEEDSLVEVWSCLLCCPLSTSGHGGFNGMR